MIQPSIFDIAVVGGGAAGLFCAVQALSDNDRPSVCVLEKLDRTGKKLLATGNGRCNLTNISADAGGYHGDKALAAKIIARFPPIAAMEAFRDIGVLCIEEDGGKVYPMSLQATSVLDALRMALAERGGAEITGFEVSGIKKHDGLFSLNAPSGQVIKARRVIFATGGLAAKHLGGGDGGHRLLAKLGHGATKMFPALVQLKTEGKLTLPMKGIKYEGLLEIYIDGKCEGAATGDVLFTEYGISGPPALQLSRMAAQGLSAGKSVYAHIHVLNMGYDDVLAELKRRKALFGGRSLEHFLTGMVNKRIGQTLIKQAGVLPLTRRADSLTTAELSAMAKALTNHPIQVVGTNGFDQAQVTAGGVKTDEFDPNTLESIRIPGLYAAGELLNVDGDCGGYNLQWAWSSGWVCAKSALSSIHQEVTI